MLLLQIQARVAEWLQRLQAEELARRKELEDKISPPDADEEKQGGSEPSRQAVAKELEALRTKLEGRKKVRALPEDVLKAKAEVVRCLREKDRRPLDCWKEVEKFKEEVRKLEQSWVDKVVS